MSYQTHASINLNIFCVYLDCLYTEDFPTGRDTLTYSDADAELTYISVGKSRATNKWSGIIHKKSTVVALTDVFKRLKVKWTYLWHKYMLHP